MTEARIEANRRRANADVIYGIGFIFGLLAAGYVLLFTGY